MVSPGASSASLGASCLPTAPAALLVTPMLDRTDGLRTSSVPVEPPPSPWVFPRPARRRGRTWSGSAPTWRPGTLLAAYRRGHLPDARARRPAADALVLAGARAASCRSTGWWCPGRCAARAATSRSGSTPPSTRWWPRCGDPRAGRRAGSPATSPRRTASCTGSGWAHSVEAWRDGELAGGLYGVAIGGLFAGESMFHRVRDASKVALVGLVGLLTDDGRRRAAARRAVGDAAPGHARGGRGPALGVPRAPRGRAPAAATPRVGGRGLRPHGSRVGHRPSGVRGWTPTEPDLRRTHEARTGCGHA